MQTSYYRNNWEAYVRLSSLRKQNRNQSLCLVLMATQPETHLWNLPSASLQIHFDFGLPQASVPPVGSDSKRAGH